MPNWAVAGAHGLHLPPAGTGHGGGNLRYPMARVADDALDKHEQPPRLSHRRLGVSMIPQADWMHGRR